MLLTVLSKIFPVHTVYAHCDIPCGIYDPYPAQIAAHTVIRMTQLLQDAHKNDKDNEDDWMKLKHDVARIVHVKEEHGERVENEVGTLENDYFKPEHLKANPELEELMKKAVKASVKARQEINMEAAQECLDAVMQIAEIFWKTKGYTSARIPSPYPHGGELVVPVKKA